MITIRHHPVFRYHTVAATRLIQRRTDVLADADRFPDQSVQARAIRRAARWLAIALEAETGGLKK